MDRLPGVEITYEIWQDDMIVATSTDPKDASHYAAVYSQDGPVKVCTVLRSDWEGLSGGMVIAPKDAEPWKCAARQGNTGANDPQNCDWPTCDCDPYAGKVIGALQESGLLRDPSEANWELLPVSNVPHPTKSGMRVVGFLLPANEAPPESVHKIIERIIGSQDAEQARDGWISVEDRLPEKGVPVVVYTPNSRFLKFQVDEWTTYHECPVGWSSATIETGEGWGDHEFEEVTHWRPLTAPDAMSAQRAAGGDDGR